MTPSRKPRIYVIGPFRAANEYLRRANIARAEALALQIAQAGALYRCPHLHSAHFDGAGGITDVYWLELGLDLLGECDAAALVEDAPGAGSIFVAPWRFYLDPGHSRASHGSIAEVAVCGRRDMPVLKHMDEVRAFVDAYRAGDRWRWEEIHQERQEKRIAQMEAQWAGETGEAEG